MRQTLVAIILCCCTSQAIAHSGDSLWTNEQHLILNAAAGMSGTLLSSGDISMFNQATLQYFNEDGSFRANQTAQKKQTLNFNTYGIKEVKRFKVFGQFIFSRTWEDSLANIMQGTPSNIRPFYYWATKSGTYDRQSYIGQTQVNYELLRNKLILSFGLDYLNQRTTRAVDPRPQIQQFNIQLQPELVFKAGSHSIGLQGIWGRGNEKVDVIYKNSNYQHSLIYPDRILYNNLGYGYLSIKDTANHIRYGYTEGAGLAYNYQSQNFQIMAQGTYTRQTDEITYNTERNDIYYITAGWEMDQIKYKLLLQKDGNKWQHQLHLRGQLDNGADWNAGFNARNYFAQEQVLTADYNLRTGDKRGRYYWMGIGLENHYLFKEDKATTHIFQTNQWEPHVWFSTLQQTKKSNYLKTSIGLHYRIAGNTQLNVKPNQINLFTQQVVYPEYLYYSSDAWGSNVHIGYTASNWIPKFPITIFAKANWEQRAGKKPASINGSAFQPSGSRSQIGAGIQLFL
jgi:hypothetical protein